MHRRRQTAGMATSTLARMSNAIAPACLRRRRQHGRRSSAASLQTGAWPATVDPRRSSPGDAQRAQVAPLQYGVLVARRAADASPRRRAAGGVGGQAARRSRDGSAALRCLRRAVRLQSERDGAASAATRWWQPPAGQRVVRAMPNTPALVGLGIIAACTRAHGGEAAPTAAPPSSRCWRRPWRAAVVRSARRDLDAVTALSGSGPGLRLLLHPRR